MAHDEIATMSVSEVLSLVAKRSALREGSEGVRSFLREVYRHPGRGARKLARKVGLPIPVVVAVRNELERVGLCQGHRGIRLSDFGKTFVENQLGFREKTSFLCSSCAGLGIVISPEMEKIKQQMRPYFERRTLPDTRIDQAFATPDTSLKRAIFLLEHDYIEGRRILFLGDSDLTSLAVALVGGARNLTVLDIDSRVGEIIQHFNRENAGTIEFVQHDLRDPIPETLQAKYNVILTDPPYTLPGVALFLSRSMECLYPEISGSIFLSFAMQSPENDLKLQQIFTENELIIKHLLLGFNIYEGAHILGGRSNFYHLMTLPSRSMTVSERYEGKLYTGEIRETLRHYRCQCGAMIEVGASSPYSTIEALKTHGCAVCGVTQGFTLVSRVSTESPSKRTP